jgi:HSP20 family protein
MLARINRNYVPAYWDDFFNDKFYNQLKTTNCSVNTPAVNVSENDLEFTIEVAAPGIEREAFDLEIENDILTISSELKEDKAEQEQNFLRREFNFQAFKRSFQLPETIDQENIKASHDAGILTIQLPKKEEVVQKAAKQIEIK